MTTLKLHWLSSLEKVFPQDPLPVNEEYSSATALQGEVFSLQLAYYSDFVLNPLQLEVISPLKEFCQIRQVFPVGVLNVGEQQDDFVLKTTPGLFPDLLSEPEHFYSPAHCWHSIWITIRIPKSFQAGNYPLQLQLKHTNIYCPDRNFTDLSPVFQLDILPVELPASSLKVAFWFYADCLYTYYQVEPWSEEFYRLLENYWKNMVAHGCSVIYVPIVTPPLDTLIGLERPTVQSVDIVHSGSNWQFDFTKMERYISLALKCGFRYLEFSHLFTQWGSKCAPKVMIAASKDEAPTAQMGWKVLSDSAEYQEFLNALLPALKAFLTSHQWEKIAYFHVSDEPAPADLEKYRHASELFRRHMQGCHFLDAVSSPEFYAKGLVDVPVPPVNRLERFADLGMPERWSYYCVSQWDQVPNQFMHFPSCRNRILGLLAFCYQLVGFLHWGYNFWFSQVSRFAVNPYENPCAGNGFPGGDAFKVYPGSQGKPEDSIRFEVFFEAVQDYTALMQLSQKIGREAVMAWIASLNQGQLPTMSQYPRSAQWLLDFRQQLNRMLAKQ